MRFLSSYSTHAVETIDDSIDYEGTTEHLLERGGYPAFIWLYAYRKEFLDKHNIRFKRLRFSEDGLFIATVYLHNPTVVSTRANIYRYVLRESSAIGNRNIAQSRACVDDGLTSYERIREQMSASVFKDNGAVNRACECSMNIKKNSCFSRMLSAEYGFSEFKAIKRRITANHFYPIVPWSNSRGNRMMCKAVNLLFSSYPTYKFGSWLFTKIFTPYILPWYRRRVWERG